MAKAKKSKRGSSGSKDLDLEVGSMIRKSREAANISQEELAVRLNTKRTAISRIENHAEDIKLSTLYRVAKALGKELKVKIG